MGKEVKLIYDAVSIPNGWDLENIVHVWKEHGLVIYDSYNKGDKPFLVDVENTDDVLIDIGTVSKETIVKIQKLIKE